MYIKRLLILFALISCIAVFSACSSDSGDNTAEFDKLYPGTDIPTYTYVTGTTPAVEPTVMDSDEELMIAVYPYDRYESEPEFLDYIQYLMDNGWGVYEKESDADKGTFFVLLSKGDESVIVETDISSDAGRVAVSYYNPAKKK